jgi:mono/diheme cytochrome c family protein
MKRVVGLAAIASFFVGGVALASQKLGQPQGERGPEEIYAKTCGYCHGKNVGPVIRGRKLPSAAVTHIVRNGQNGMPSFRQTEITKTELAALSRWISKSKADAKEKGQ